MIEKDLVIIQTLSESAEIGIENLGNLEHFNEVTSLFKSSQFSKICLKG